jgi:voltage-gated potassium channel
MTPLAPHLRPHGQRLLIVLGLVLVTLVIGLLFYRSQPGYSFADAFYMAVITMATVGYGEVRPLTAAGRVFNSLYIILSVSVLFVAIAMVSSFVIEVQLGNIFGKRRIRRMIEQLNNHFIVCGLGRVGRGAAEELHRSQVPFIVVDTSDDKVEWAIKEGMLAVVADATRDETLRDVGIERARGVIAALATDADNLFLTLSAKSLNPLINVSARANEEESETKMRRAGADSVFAPYNFTGRRLAQSILRPHVTQFLDFTTLGPQVGIEQVRVGAASEFAAKSLSELRQLRKELGVSVLAIRRADGRMVLNPAAQESINEGDSLIVMGEIESLHKLERMMAEAKP